MAKNIPEKTRPVLTVSHADAKNKIETQIKKSESIPNYELGKNDDVDRWYSFTSELLKQLFTNNDIADEFQGLGSFFDMDISLGRYKRSLLKILDRIELFPTQFQGTTTGIEDIAKKKTRKVFVVHGHDEAARESLCRYLEKLELIPIILHEQPNSGKTIVEKFEKYADVGFAIALLTPDDEGRSLKDPNFKSRARQNVIFEMGYFIGAIGRENVCCLYKSGVEIPSDYSGVIYTEMDINSGWKLLLAREISNSGIQIDMNKAL